MFPASLRTPLRTGALSSWLLVSLACCSPHLAAEEPPATVEVHWNNVVQVSRTKPSLLFIGTPKTEAKSPLRLPILKAVKDLNLDDVRYSPCNLYPRLDIPELDPPTATSTSWDFLLLDPEVDDALRALAGHPVIFNFSTIPEWMIKTAKPVPYPSDPDQPISNYEQGDELRDPTYREVADYYVRVANWYANGGFTDELGKWHQSGHHYKIDYWEVLNEPDVEHHFSPQAYTRIYDTIVEALRKVLPNTKFVGLSNSYPGGHPDLFEYFLDPRNHKPGIPLDMISYHFYAVPDLDEPADAHPFIFFAQADRFLEVTGYIETIRKRLSPATGTMVDEIGTMHADDWGQAKTDYIYKPLPASYWNLSAAVYAYVFARLSSMGIDVATESMIAAYPGNFASIAMMDWNTGQPNARYWVLKLMGDNFHPGDKLVETQLSGGPILAQGFVGPDGTRKLLLINKRDRDLALNLPEARGGKVEAVDKTTGSNPPSSAPIKADQLQLGALGVAVVTLPR
jgi:hypothetical protein